MACILRGTMSKLIQASGAAAAATMASRVLGFARETVYAGFYGDTAVASAFVAAFTIPNLFRRLLGEGALTSVFVPVFARREKEEGSEAAMRGGASVVVAVAGLCTAGIVALMLLATALVEWVPMPVQRELMLRLTRLMLPYAAFVCVAAVFMAMLNARGHYFVPALGSATMSVVMIGSVYGLAPLFGSTLEQQVAGLAVGVILAGVAQAAFQWPALRKEGFRLSMSIPWRDPTVRESFTRLVPATVGVAAYQFNVVATQAIGSLQADHVLASYNYAVRLLELPQGVIGVSVATYLLTELSRKAADKHFPEFRRLVADGMLHLCFLNGLASVLLAVLAEPIIRLLFEHGRFDEASTARAAIALRMLAPGLLATSLTGILSRSFYALDDVRVPMRIGVFCLGMNVVLALLLAFPFQQAGLAAANALTALLNAALLLYALRRKMPKFDLRALLPSMGRMAALVAMAGIVAWGAHALWDSWVGHHGKLRQVGAVFAPALVALAAYLGASLAAGIPQAHDLATLLQRKLRLRND